MYHRLCGSKPEKWQRVKSAGFQPGTSRQETTGASVLWSGMASRFDRRQPSLSYCQKITKRRSSDSIAINLCKEHNYPLRYCKHGWHTSTIWCAVEPHNQPHGRENYQDSNDQEREESRSCCAGDGLKLKPMVIFKRKTVPKVANKHGVVIATQDGHWRNEDMSSESLACATRWPGETKKPVSLRRIWNSRDREHELGCNSGWVNVNFPALRYCLEQTF